MSTLFTYDMLRDIWVPLLSGIIGGLFTLIRSVYKELHADHETGAADNK